MPPRLPLGLAAPCVGARAFTSSAALAQKSGAQTHAFAVLTNTLAGQTRTKAPPNAPVYDNKEHTKFQHQFRQGERYEPNSWNLKKILSSRKPRGDMFARFTGGGTDVINMLGYKDILMQYKNFAFLSDFTTSMGRIRHRDVTGLTPKNQRKVAKAIRRAVGLGLLPSTHRHPATYDTKMESRFTRE